MSGTQANSVKSGRIDELTLLGNHPFWDRWFDSGADAVDDPSHGISGGDIPVFETEG
jgi:hypothetical protein